MIDGFPRNKDNDANWREIFGDKINFMFIFFIECSVETMKNRISERGKTSGRLDDNLESMKKRLSLYDTETILFINSYDRNFIVRINGKGLPNKVLNEYMIQKQ